MPEPIIETIAAAIATQLATITVANGYSEDATVIRPKAFSGYNPEHGQIVLMQEDRFDNEDAENRQSWTQPFTIAFFVRPSEDDPTSHDTYFNRRAADIEKALYSERNEWFVDGMIDWQLVGPSLMPDEAESGGGVYTLNVDYRHNVGDPYTA